MSAVCTLQLYIVGDVIRSRLRSLNVVDRPSVCLSVCLSSTCNFVRPMQAIEIVSHVTISMQLGTLAIH